jgi:hypothetical protein
MKAIRLEARVGHDRTLVLQRPPETPEGAVEVIVLVPETRSDTTDFLEHLARHTPGRSKAAIDEALRDERHAWDSR